jgi:hypothetical protein
MVREDQSPHPLSPCYNHNMPEISRFFGIIIRMYMEVGAPHHDPHYHAYIYSVTQFAIVRPYVLRVQFDDGTQQEIDFQPVLSGDLYRPLRDLSLFEQVKIDPEVHTLVWPNGADFDPETLHNWPNYIDTLISRAQAWEMVSA